MLIHVTQEDIYRGFRQNCTRCPVAIAVKRVVNCDLAVGGGYISLYHPIAHAYEIRYPSSVGLFITNFDRGWYEVALPFDFEIDIPEEYLCKR